MEQMSGMTVMGTMMNSEQQRQMGDMRQHNGIVNGITFLSP